MLMSSCDTLTSISCVMRNRTFVLMCMFQQVKGGALCNGYYCILQLSQVVDERDRLANKQPRKRKETKNRAALEEPEDEEKQILITQVNAYSRECDKLKGQLQTAREESNKKVDLSPITCGWSQRNQQCSCDLCCYVS